MGALHHYSTTQNADSKGIGNGEGDVAPRTNHKLPPHMMAESAILAGLGFGGAGVAIGAYAMGGAVPVGVLLASIPPMALGTVYMPRTADGLQARVLMTSSACIPIGMATSSLLELAAWPALGSVAMIFGPAMAAGYSVFHLSQSQDTDPELISTPTFPFSQALHTIGLWNASTPWAHKQFRDTFKLYFWYSCLGAIPVACNLYGGWSVMLGCLLLWQYCIKISSASMAVGFFLSKTDDMIPLEHKGKFLWLTPQAVKWSRWLLDNSAVHAMWILAFYGFLPAASFYAWFKWTHGVHSSPFDVEDKDGGSIYEGQRAFWLGDAPLK